VRWANQEPAEALRENQIPAKPGAAGTVRNFAGRKVFRERHRSILVSGTDGSNPSPSSGESCANPTRHPPSVMADRFVQCSALGFVRQFRRNDHRVSGRRPPLRDNLAIYNFEITDTQRYERWLLERWSVPSSSPRYNTSIPLLTRENTTKYMGYIAELTMEDRCLYDRVLTALDCSGASSIMGSVLL
jgi:hypothetical protein